MKTPKERQSVAKAPVARVVAALALAAILSVHQLHAAIATFQNGVAGYSGTEDTSFLHNINDTADLTWGTQNYGGFPLLFTASNNANLVGRSVIRFDLSSLAGQYSSINSITLELTIAQSSSANTVQLFEPVPANAGWVAGTGTGTFQANTSTWNKRSQTTTTTGADWFGGPGLGPDLNGSGYGPVLASNTYSPGQSGKSSFFISGSAQATALINDFVGGSNPGFLLVATNEGSSTYFEFQSSNNGTVTSNPKLIVDFNPVPEPSVCAILAFGALSAFGLRRGRGRRAYVSDFRSTAMVSLCR